MLRRLLISPKLPVVLAAVDGGPRPYREVMADTGLPFSHFSQLLHRLEDMGLVGRTGGHKSAMLTWTADGLAMVELLATIHDAWQVFTRRDVGTDVSAPELPNGSL